MLSISKNVKNKDITSVYGFDTIKHVSSNCEMFQAQFIIYIPSSRLLDKLIEHIKLSFLKKQN